MEEEVKILPQAMFTFRIALPELIHALVNKKVALAYFLIDSVTIPPGWAIIYTIPVTERYVAIPIEVLFIPDPDHVLGMVIYLDGKLFATDSDMVATQYEGGINFLRDYQLVKDIARKNIEAVFTNTSTTEATLNLRFVWVEMPDYVYNRIVERYYEVISEWLEL